jgi:2-polyprenyl-3-methyl-5-hydroxy-6-metoxy-1,4-benzoquinol methylase
MGVLPFPEFDRIHHETVREVYAHWSPSMQERLAENCRGWAPDAFDFRNYLEASSVRFYRAYLQIAALAPGRRICDIGGFWGVFAVTLQALGFDVTMTESLDYYGGVFDPLFRAIEARGIAVVNYDPFAPDRRLPARFDAVTVMAVIEHYPHSLKPFLGNVKGLLGPSGIVHIEVPNIAFWPKRVAFLRGETPLADARTIFRSGTPFVGHHHEFTMDELRGIAELAGLEVVREDFYNYSLLSMGWKRKVRKPLETLAFALAPSTRECLSITCRGSKATTVAR